MPFLVPAPDFEYKFSYFFLVIALSYFFSLQPWWTGPGCSPLTSWTSHWLSTNSIIPRCPPLLVTSYPGCPRSHDRIDRPRQPALRHHRVRYVCVMWRRACHPGPRLNIKMVFRSMGSPIMKLRRSSDRLIFIIGITKLVSWYLYIETPPGGHNWEYQTFTLSFSQVSTTQI